MYNKFKWHGLANGQNCVFIFLKLAQVARISAFPMVLATLLLLGGTVNAGGDAPPSNSTNIETIGYTTHSSYSKTSNGELILVSMRTSPNLWASGYHLQFGYNQILGSDAQITVYCSESAFQTSVSHSSESAEILVQGALSGNTPVFLNEFEVVVQIFLPTPEDGNTLKFEAIAGGIVEVDIIQGSCLKDRQSL